MATFLDVGLLQYFNIIFVVLLIFSFVFAILQKTKVLGSSAAINAIIALVAGIMVILSKTVLSMINFMTPWFVVMIIFFILLLLIFKIFGASDESIAGALKDKTLLWTLIGMGLVIFLAAYGMTMGESLAQESGEGVDQNVSATSESGTSGRFQGNVVDILFNTKVLGILLILGIAVFAIAFLSGNTMPPS